MSMYTNSLSGGVVGQTGSFGPLVQLLQQRQQRDELWLGGPSSMFGYTLTQGYNTNQVLNAIENDMGYQNGSLSWSKSIVNNYNDDAVLFQDPFGNFAEIDLKKNSYEIKSEKSLVESMGIKTSTYDNLFIDQFGFRFYQFKQTGLGDGKKDYASVFYKFDNQPWGYTSIVQAEGTMYDNGFLY